jgi:hypothetical protein
MAVLWFPAPTTSRMKGGKAVADQKHGEKQICVWTDATEGDAV